MTIKWNIESPLVINKQIELIAEDFIKDRHFSKENNAVLYDDGLMFIFTPCAGYIEVTVRQESL